MPDKINFTTPDDLLVVGDWQPATTTYAAALLLHSMPETRKSWSAVQAVWARKGIASLAIDLRGHGESVETLSGGKWDYRQFTDEQHQDSLYDVQAAIRWIRDRGVPLERLFIVGASIGANLAVQALAEEPKMPGAILLSPGKNYRGLDAVDEVDRLNEAQAVYVVASEDDQPAFEESRELYDVAPSQVKVFQPYQTGGHGTAMLLNDPTLTDKLADWILEVLS